MSSLKVVLNREGIRELLRSDEMAEICADEAKKVCERAGEGFEYDKFKGKNRVNSMVYPVTRQASAKCRKENTLLKALK